MVAEKPAGADCGNFQAADSTSTSQLKQQQSRMTPQRRGQRFGPLDTETDALVFDHQDPRLWNSTDVSQQILTQFLKLAKGSDRFADRNVDVTLCRGELLHLTFSDNRVPSGQ